MPHRARLAPRFRTREDSPGELAGLPRGGRPVISLVRGYLPGDLPRDLRGLGADAWREGHVGFVEGPGLESLRDAVVDWLDVRDARSADDVLISPGSRAACASVLSAVTGPGDVVLIDAAAWMVFHEMVAASGAVPVPLAPRNPEGSLKLQAEDLRALLPLYPGVRALVIANPVNPTAALYGEAELAGLVEACAANEVFLVVDRVYGMLVYDGGRFPYQPPTPAFRDWCVLVDGVARAFRGMGGVRVGWACGPRDVIRAAAGVQSAVAGPADRVAQRVALAALRAPYDLSLIEELEATRDHLVDLLGEIPGLATWPIAGTMFALLDLSPWLGRSTPVGWVMESANDLADFLASEAQVLVTPGEILGHRGLVRVAFAQKLEVVSEAVGRIREALGLLS